MIARRIPALAIATACLLAAGCGASQSNTAGTTVTSAANAATAPQQFLSEGNAACRAANKQVAALPVETIVTVKHDFVAALTIAVRLHTELEALKPPAVVVPTYRAFVRNTQQQIVVGRKLIAEVGPPIRVQAVRSTDRHLQQLSKQGDAIAKTLGWFACAASVSPRGAAPSAHTPAARALSRFVTQANSVCHAANRQVAALPVETSHTARSDLRAMLAIANEQQAKLETIKPPALAAVSYRELLNNFQKGFVVIHRLVVDLGPPVRTQSTLTTLHQLARLAARTDAIAKALGLPACAASVTPRGTASAS
jgi:hypothetical protein